MIKVIAHRGASNFQLENSVAAFTAAAKAGVDLIETDIQVTKDRELVIFHDKNLDRVTNGQGNISDYDYDWLKEHVKLNNGESISTLSEICLFSRKNNIEFIFELKNPDTAEQALDIISEIIPAGSFIIASFFHEQLLKLKQKHPSVLTCAIFECYPVKVSEFIVGINCDFASIGYESTNKKMIEELKRAGVQVYLWTVNSEDDIRCAIEMQCDGIISNNPDLVSKILSSNTNPY